MDQVLDVLRRQPCLRPGERILAAMSGGVDSSVMAALLHRAGYEVVGVSMRLFDKGTTTSTALGRCCSLDDFQDARRVAHQVGFSHYVMDFEAQFKATVIDPFIEGYRLGETPSPCILCNQHLKFNALQIKAEELGCGFVATGHYARIIRDAQGHHLLKAQDAQKDQSYFLFAHSQATLAHTLFPLGGLDKHQVRELGRQMGLHLAEKQESQEICFVSQKRYDEFLETASPVPLAAKGPLRYMDGRILGEHEGYWRYTVGQRKGLRVAHSEPLYVVKTDPATNTVWVGEEIYLFATRLSVRDLSLCLSPPALPLHCAAKPRSRSMESPVTIESMEGDHALVVFREPQRALAPGQAIVFYQGEEVLGGGWIQRVG